jgi:hypothetical protein
LTYISGEPTESILLCDKPYFHAGCPAGFPPFLLMRRHNLRNCNQNGSIALTFDAGGDRGSGKAGGCNRQVREMVVIVMVVM